LRPFCGVEKADALALAGLISEEPGIADEPESSVVAYQFGADVVHAGMTQREGRGFAYILDCAGS
jgi:hypothetical protein